MKNIKRNLPKATSEVVKEYDKLNKWMDGMDPTFPEKELNATASRIALLEEQYDWFHVEFTDPVTGKKGLKSVSDEVIAPALFDGLGEYQSYTFSPYAPVIAIKDGKCGIIKGDGSGEQLSEFKFDSISSLGFANFYVARWGGEKDHFGIIEVDGEVICPNILTCIDEPFNDITIITNVDKFGIIDIRTHQCVLPEYDSVNLDEQADVIFYKGDQRGYITKGDGKFITLEQYKNDDKYEDIPMIATRLF